MARSRFTRTRTGSVWFASLALATGCHQLTPSARQQLADGAHAYNIARYGPAKETLTSFINDNDQSQEVSEAYYIRGLARLKLRQRTEARQDFQAAVAKSARKDVTLRAQTSLAIMAYDDADWASAVRHYEDAILWINDLRDYDDHLLRYAISLQRLGRWEESSRMFADILQDHPSGSASKTAKIMLGWNHPYFTVQCHALGKAQAADKEVARLRATGLKAAKTLDTRSGRAMYLVQVGKYRTYDEALQGLQRVRRIGEVSTARVVP